MTLWKSIIGSHAWGMERPESDVDYWETYAVRTADILCGRTSGGNSSFTPGAESGKNEDIARHEVGKVIQELQKGNINFIVSLVSPLIMYSSRWHHDLRKIFEANPAKGVMHSCKGMAYGNLKKYEGKDDRPVRIAKTLRVLNFARDYIRSGGQAARLERVNVTDELNWNVVRSCIDILENAHRESELPERPDPTPYEQYLLGLRTADLQSDPDVYDPPAPGHAPSRPHLLQNSLEHVLEAGRGY